MRKSLVVFPIFVLLAGSVTAFADDFPVKGSVDAAPTYEGRADDENRSDIGAAMKDKRHSIENANPNRTDFPPSQESKGP